MTDARLVKDLLGSLSLHCGYLAEDSQCTLEEFLKDRRIHQTAERNLEISVQCCIDIGVHLISDDGLGKAEDYSDIFKPMSESRIISCALAVKMSNLARFRNLLVHLYAKVDKARVYEFIKNNLIDFDEFGKAVMGYIR